MGRIKLSQKQWTTLRNYLGLRFSNDFSSMGFTVNIIASRTWMGESHVELEFKKPALCTEFLLKHSVILSQVTQPAD